MALSQAPCLGGACPVFFKADKDFAQRQGLKTHCYIRFGCTHAHPHAAPRSPPRCTTGTTAGGTNDKYGDSR